MSRIGEKIFVFVGMIKSVAIFFIERIMMILVGLSPDWRDSNLDKNLTQGNPIRLIILFAIPLLLGNFFQQIYNIADMFIVGRTLGANAMGAVGSTGSILFFLIGFIFGAEAGFGIVTAQYYGAKNEKGVRRSFASGAICSAFIGILLMVFGILFVDPILHLLETPEELYANARIYLLIIFWGILPLVFYNLMANMILALGDSRTPLIFLIITCVLNIVLDYIFILFCGWGVGGAAGATVLAQVISGICCLIYVWKKQPLLILKKEDWKVGWADLMHSMRIGLPMGFQASVIAIGCIVVQVYINKLGPASVAAFSAAEKVNLLALMPLMSFGIAMATYVGQNYGAGKYDRIRQGVRQCSILSLSVAIGMAWLNISFGVYFVELFVGEEDPLLPQISELAQMYMGLNAPLYWVLGLLFVYRYTLQGLGKSFVPTFAGVMELVMRIGASVLFAAPLGFGGICLASPLAWIGAAVPLGVAYFYVIRRLDYMDSNGFSSSTEDPLGEVVGRRRNLIASD